MRLTLSIAGQAVAVRVITSSSNDLYYLYNDHLGSTSAIATSSNTLVTGSRAYHAPFGEYRGTAPTQTITDRGYTGHLHNNTGSNGVGLIYMNARFYVSSINRFASADIIVPNPVEPQSFNRYSYTYNNPLRFVDPTGHCGADTQSSLTNSCSQLQSSYEQNYGIHINGQWTLAEMETLGLALQDLVNKLGSLLSFQDAFAGRTISRVRESTSAGGDWAVTDGWGNMTMYDKSFTSVQGDFSQDLGRWAILHEFGHAWDYARYDGSDGEYSTWDLYRKLIFSGGSGDGLLNATGSDYAGNDYLAAGIDVVSNYARDTHQEDFAESFAAYFFGGNLNVLNAALLPHQQRTITPGGARWNYIKSQLINQQWKLLVFGPS